MLGKQETGERRRGEKRKAGDTVSLGLPDFSRWILPRGANGCLFLPSWCTLQKSLGEMGREYLYVSEVAAGLAGDFPENFNQCINAGWDGSSETNRANLPICGLCETTKRASYRAVWTRMRVGVQDEISWGASVETWVSSGRDMGIWPKQVLVFLASWQALVGESNGSKLVAEIQAPCWAVEVWREKSDKNNKPSLSCACHIHTHRERSLFLKGCFLSLNRYAYNFSIQSLLNSFH